MLGPVVEEKQGWGNLMEVWGNKEIFLEGAIPEIDLKNWTEFTKAKKEWMFFRHGAFSKVKVV